MVGTFVSREILQLRRFHWLLIWCIVATELNIWNCWCRPPTHTKVRQLGLLFWSKQDGDFQQNSCCVLVGRWTPWYEMRKRWLPFRSGNVIFTTSKWCSPIITSLERNSPLVIWAKYDPIASRWSYIKANPIIDERSKMAPEKYNLWP